MIENKRNEIFNVILQYLNFKTMASVSVWSLWQVKEFIGNRIMDLLSSVRTPSGVNEEPISSYPLGFFHWSVCTDHRLSTELWIWL